MFLISDFFPSIFGRSVILSVTESCDRMYALPYVFASTIQRKKERKRQAEVADEWTWPCVFCTIIKEGMETKVTYLALLCHSSRERQKPLQQPAGEEERGEALLFFFSFSSLCLAGFCSPLRSYISCTRCMKFTLSEKPNTSLLPTVTVGVNACVCVQGSSVYGMHNTAQVWGKPVITPIAKIAHDPFDSNFFILHLLFFPPPFFHSLWPRLHACNLCW